MKSFESRCHELRRDPAAFIGREIRDYIAESPLNRFVPYPEEPIWDEPMVGFADGDDPIFTEYKTIIGDFHLTPREALEMRMLSTGYGDTNSIGKISVISFLLPATEKTRTSNRRETEVCSLRWNHTRFQGQELIFRLSRHLAALLEDMGYLAVAPELARWWEIVKLPSGFSSRWSQRHMAYAAGLGSFGLSDGFITQKGIAVRAGSVVCNLEIPPTPRRHAGPYSNCLFHRKGSCMACAKRCPAGAISEKGHDKNRCWDYLLKMKEIAERHGKTEGCIGQGYMGCGFCQTGVPCEKGIPQEGARSIDQVES